MNERSEVVEVNSANILAIPCSAKEFGDFLSGLLKSPRTISRGAATIIDIDLSDILDFIAAVGQRVGDQHNHTMVSFDARITYQDGRTVVLPDIAQLESYAEIGVRRCVEISVVLAYLLEVPTSEVPARQEIEITFLARPPRRIGLAELGERITLPSIYWRSGVYYTIRHTAISFGYDIANLLDEKISGVAVDDRLARYARNKLVRWFALIMCSAAGMALGATLMMSLYSSIGNLEGGLSAGRAYAMTVVLEAVTSFMLISSSVGALIIGNWLLEILSRSRPSFISLSERSKRAAIDELQRQRRRWLFVAAGLLGTIVVGVISSIIASAIWDTL